VLVLEEAEVQEGVPGLAEDVEGHFVVVEIQQEVLSQKRHEELLESQGYWIYPRTLPTPLSMDDRPCLVGQHVDLV